MHKQFIISTFNNTKEFVCLSVQSSITILRATPLNEAINWPTLADNTYLEISFSYTNESAKSKQWIQVRPLNLLIDVFQKQTVIQLNKVFYSSNLINTNHFYNKLFIKLIDRNYTVSTDWRIEYDSHLLTEI